jgi:hypothetical protein
LTQNRFTAAQAIRCACSLLARISGMRGEGMVEGGSVDVLCVLGQMVADGQGKPALAGYGMGLPKQRGEPSYSQMAGFKIRAGLPE